MRLEFPRSKLGGAGRRAGRPRRASFPPLLRRLQAISSSRGAQARSPRRVEVRVVARLYKEGAGGCMRSRGAEEQRSASDLAQRNAGARLPPPRAYLIRRVQLTTSYGFL